MAAGEPTRNAATALAATRLERRMSRGALRISLLYLGLGVVWILGSDAFFGWMFPEPWVQVRIQTFKGVGYVVATAGLLYLLVHRLGRSGLEAHRLLEDSEASHRAMFEGNPSPMYLYELDSLRILRANAAAAAFYGWSQDEFTRLDLYALRPPEEYAQLRARAEAGRDQTANVVHASRHWRKDGSLLDVQVNVQTLAWGGRAVRLAIIRDRTAELAALRGTESALRRLQETQQIARLGSWELDLGAGTLYWSAQAWRLHGLEPPAGPRLQPLAAAVDLVHPDDRERLAAMRAATATHGHPLACDYRVQWADGSVRHLQERGERVLDDTGRPLLLRGSVQDVTERQVLLQQLEEREERFRSLVGLLPDGVAVLEADVIRYANTTLARLFGFSSARLAEGRRLRDLVSDGAQPRLARLLAGRPSGDGGFVPMTLRRLDGSPFEAELGARTVRLGAGEVVLVVIHDLSEPNRIRAELERSHAELQALTGRMFSVQEEERRRLSRELHDDVGQAITAIKLVADSLRGVDDPIQRGQGIDDLGAIADETIGKLRDLSMLLRPPQLDALGLESALRWQVDTLFRDRSEAVQLDIQPLPQRAPPEVELACFRIAQEGLTNVLRHARASAVRISLAQQDGEIALSLVDDGQGFPAGPAAGLGLVGIRERAQLLGGRVEIESQPALGTRIRAWLPLGEASAGRATDADAVLAGRTVQ